MHCSINHNFSKNLLNSILYDTIVYRVFSKERFCELLLTKELSLVNPRKWDDPFENFFLKNNAVDEHGVLISLESLYQSWFGQCWTLNVDSDAMWRIYSPSGTGVRVSTTVGELFGSMWASQGKNATITTFAGKVVYKTQSEIEALVKQLTFQEVMLGGDQLNFAQLLMVKREAFEHEREVRFLISPTNVEPAKIKSGVFPIKINFEKIFRDVCIDPRMPREEAKHFEDMIKSKVNVKIYQSDLYRCDLPPIRLS